VLQPQPLILFPESELALLLEIASRFVSAFFMGSSYLTLKTMQQLEIYGNSLEIMRQIRTLKLKVCHTS